MKYIGNRISVLKLKIIQSASVLARSFLLLIFFSPLVLFVSCERQDMLSMFIVYKIGESGPGGGIVFYVTDGGSHGLEAAPAGWNGGVDPTVVWINSATTPDPQGTLNGNTQVGIGTGFANSNYIIAQANHTSSAAQVCRDYHGGGKTDWFLPSKDELNYIYQNLYSAIPNIGGLSTGVNYWSSSEYDDYTTNSELFDATPIQTQDSKGSANRVRPVRAF